MRSIQGSLFCAAALFTVMAACGPSPEPMTPESGSAKDTGQTGVKPPTADTRPAQSLPTVTATLAEVGLDAAAIDRSVDPCKDFYQFACGGWLAKTEIPGDEPIWGRSFSEIDKRNEELLRGILEEASKTKESDAVTRKLGDYYGACMDEAAVEAAGIKPIKGLLDKAKKAKDPKSIGAVVTELHRVRIFPLFELSSEQDFKDATRVIAVMDQGGLGLFDRDQYLAEDDKSKDIRATYVAHIERMMNLAGLPAKDAKKAASDVMTIETELAKVSKTRVERRDPKGLYNKIDRAGVLKVAPDFPWEVYFKGMGIQNVNDINVTSVPFFEGVSRLLSSVKPDAWQNYLQWTIVRSTAGLLPKRFVDESFALTSALLGQKEQRPRWKRCVDSTDTAMGELLGQPFVKVAFGGESKKAAEAMVLEISRAFGRELERIDWMDQKTKARAMEKLRAMAYLIGYPDKWRTYDFKVDAKTYAQNVFAAREFEEKRRLAKIGKPFDRDEWQMSPPAVNAYYDPQRNHMVFPAGILQSPFYSVKSAVAVNLGSIGLVVGHELTHGFDDEGSQFSGNGNLENWWEPAVSERFKAKTSCVADQYSAYEVAPGMKINGRLTLGENIADMGGLKLAFAAYREMRKGAASMTVADGFTEDQQFFLAHGQVWCSKMRPEIERIMVLTNPHSPPRFRVNGPLSSMPQFAEAFSCAKGTPMRPEKTCSVW